MSGSVVVRRSLVCTIVAAAFLAAAPLVEASPPSVVVQVGGDEEAVAHDMFWPDAVVVEAGSTVQWHSVAEDTPHTVTAMPNGGPPMFDSSPNVTQSALGPLFGPGGVLSREAPNGYTTAAEFRHTFDTPGTYTIRCKIHPEMVQVVTIHDDTSQRGEVYSMVGGGGAHASVDVFAPSSLNLSKGQTMVWSVLSVEIHTVTGFAGVHTEAALPATAPEFDSSPALTPAVFATIEAFFTDPAGFFKPQQTFNVTFPDAGTFPYFCKLHSGMKGVVIVLPKMAASPSAAGGRSPGAGAVGSILAVALGCVWTLRVRRQS